MALNISCRISLQPAVFPDFTVFKGRTTSATVVVFSSPKCTSCASDDVIVTVTCNVYISLRSIPRTGRLHFIANQTSSNCRAAFLRRSVMPGDGCVFLLVGENLRALYFSRMRRTEKVGSFVLKTKGLCSTRLYPTIFSLTLSPTCVNMFGHISAADFARELFRHSKDAESLAVTIFKKLRSFASERFLWLTSKLG